MRNELKRETSNLLMLLEEERKRVQRVLENVCSNKLMREEEVFVCSEIASASDSASSSSMWTWKFMVAEQEARLIHGTGRKHHLRCFHKTRASI